MRLIFLLLALVAAATAVPKLHINAGNVDALKKQRDILLLTQQLFQDIPNEELRKLGMEFDIKEHLHDFTDEGVVKFLFTKFRLGRLQRKGVPFTVSVSDLRMEISALTKTFLAAKDYTTFLKVACWARRNLNENQFIKAFITAILQRPDTKDIVILPAMYEVFPYYYFDARVIRKAKDLRMMYTDKTMTKKVMEIPVDWSMKSWLPKGEDKLTYFTDDIGLANFYYYFSLAGWVLPRVASTTDDRVAGPVDCDRCELGRGSMWLYTHQQLMARYNLERLSNYLRPIKEIDYVDVRTPFKSYLTYPNGLDFPGRFYDINLMPEKEHLIKTVWLLEQRIKDAIDSGFVMSTQGSLLALYDRKGVDILGNLIEATGRSINPRFYGAFQGVARELLGGAPYTREFFEPTPSALEMHSTAVRDPVFYELFKKIIKFFKRYTDSLPFYKETDLLLPGVIIEDVKFDKLATYCDKFMADIDAVTHMNCDKDKEEFGIKAVVDRLNHKPFKFEIAVNSDKVVKNAVVRVFMGPKFDYYGRYVDITKNRFDFVELDQFFWDIKEGRTVIVRNSIDAPMRSVDFETRKALLRKIEDGLDSHQPFYPYKIPQMTGFPERLALPKGRRDGLPLQIVVLITDSKAKTLNYGPVVSKTFQTYNTLNFGDLVGDYMKVSWDKLHSRLRNEDISGEDDTYMRHSGERVDYDHDYIRDKIYKRYERSIGDRDFGTVKDRDYNRDITRDRDASRERDVTRDRTSGRFDTDYHDVDTTTHGKNLEYMNDYYKDKRVVEMVGGFVSLDGRPLGFPFDRPLCDGCLWIPNFKVIDMKVYFEGKDCMF